MTRGKVLPPRAQRDRSARARGSLWYTAAGVAVALMLTWLVLLAPIDWSIARSGLFAILSNPWAVAAAVGAGLGLATWQLQRRRLAQNGLAARYAPGAWG